MTNGGELGGEKGQTLRPVIVIVPLCDLFAQSRKKEVWRKDCEGSGRVGKERDIICWIASSRWRHTTYSSFYTTAQHAGMCRSYASTRRVWSRCDGADVFINDKHHHHEPSSCRSGSMKDRNQNTVCCLWVKEISDILGSTGKRSGPALNRLRSQEMSLSEENKIIIKVGSRRKIAIRIKRNEKI